VRAALEILLFSIGDRVLDGRDDLKAFYAHEIPEWSRKMEFALAHLAQSIVSQSEELTQEEASTA
jgi:hypothetical protein